MRPACPCRRVHRDRNQPLQCAVAVDRRSGHGAGQRASARVARRPGSGSASAPGQSAPGVDSPRAPARRSGRRPTAAAQSAHAADGLAGAAAAARRIRSRNGRCLLKSDTSDLDALTRMLTRLKLTAIRDQLDSLLDTATRRKLTLLDTVKLLCEAEVARKDERRIQM